MPPVSPPRPAVDPPLTRNDQFDNPLLRLFEDRTRARAQQDPCANLCTLANIDEQGAPQARTLVLRELDNQLAVFVNVTSPKWQSLLAGPVSLVVWLPSIQLQYRLSCQTAQIPQHKVHDSWHMRPDPPKRMDWFYSEVAAQSSGIGNRETLLGALEDLQLPEPLTPPVSAQGLYLEPESVERLHLGEENGIHDRQFYRRTGSGWSVNTLVP
jgi:pyridoxamine 5'-phosphate oxidase